VGMQRLIRQPTVSNEAQLLWRGPQRMRNNIYKVHFGSIAEVSLKHIGSAAEVSGHFGSAAEVSQDTSVVFTSCVLWKYNRSSVHLTIEVI